MKTHSFKTLLVLIALVTLTGCFGLKSDQTPTPAQTVGLTDSYGNAVSAACQAWFDGCNNCHVNGDVMACTKKFCPQESLQPATCLDKVRVSNLEADQTVSSPLVVEGEARGYWFFEADFPVEIVDTLGNRLGSGIASAQGDWMTEDFVPFTVTINFDAANATEGELVLKRDNPSGLPENDDEVRIPVRF
ncbi:hypothetical protein IPJ72_06860 [Candidatus Peregrinibacteria bacterium]|nr:MAG: hypothetical protein IPJ72_06860 [Candidatus Peregrinibacteria bacterium]